ncbi:MAG: hypothetical protein ACTHM9_06590 [Gemmatimonadales bacterium]|jgi:hypothetical protein
MSRAALLSAFDETIAAVHRLQQGALRTAHGGPATDQLARLLSELDARRADVAAGRPLDPDWARRTVRWVAEWLPDGELPLLARLGAIVRAASTAAPGTP